MPLALEKARTSSEDWKLLEILIVADEMLSESTSVMVSEASIIDAPSSSVKASVFAASETAGASLLKVIDKSARDEPVTFAATSDPVKEASLNWIVRLLMLFVLPELSAAPLNTNFAVVLLVRIADADNPAGTLAKVTPGIAVSLLPSKVDVLGLLRVIIGSVVMLPSFDPASRNVVVLYEMLGAGVAVVPALVLKPSALSPVAAGVSESVPLEKSSEKAAFPLLSPISISKVEAES